MPDREKVIKEKLDEMVELTRGLSYAGFMTAVENANDILAMLKEQEARIQKYEYVFDFLGIGFIQWVTKILNGEAEAICETDEHEYKTVVTFKLI